MKNYQLSWLKSKQNSKANTKGNPIDVSQVEHQDYQNTKETFKNDSKRTYNLFNTLN